MQRHLRLIMLATLLGATCAHAAEIDPCSIAASAVLGDRYPDSALARYLGCTVSGCDAQVVSEFFDRTLKGPQG